jgi:hypothetical protein
MFTSQKEATMRENVFTFVVRDDERERAQGMAERYLQTNPETPVGHRTYLGSGGIEYLLRLMSVEPKPEVTVYTWELSGVGKVSNVAEIVAANGGDPVVKLNG